MASEAQTKTKQNINLELNVCLHTSLSLYLILNVQAAKRVKRLVRGLQWPVQPDQPHGGVGQEEGGVPADTRGHQPGGHEVRHWVC